MAIAEAASIRLRRRSAAHCQPCGGCDGKQRELGKARTFVRVRRPRAQGGFRRHGERREPNRPPVRRRTAARQRQRTDIPSTNRISGVIPWTCCRRRRPKLSSVSARILARISSAICVAELMALRFSVTSRYASSSDNGSMIGCAVPRGNRSALSEQPPRGRCETGSAAPDRRRR